MTSAKHRPPPARQGAPARRDVLAVLAAGVLSARPGWASSEAPAIETLTVGRSALELQFAPGFGPAVKAEARAWVRRSADAVARYFGAFPVAQAEVLLTPADGSGVRGGVTYGEPSLLIRIRLGRETTHAQFLDDWIMVHEMNHLAVPRVPRSQNWLHEGIATYVEGVARGRAGLVAPAMVWKEWAAAMPKGQPQAGDAGLDHTPTWGRTYWGGAMFCLLADVELLRRSQGHVGLQQALQGVLAAGGSYAVAWPLPRILAVADAATGHGVLAALYAQMRDPSPLVDLDKLFDQLGVRDGGFDNAAPLSAVRRAILG